MVHFIAYIASHFRLRLWKPITSGSRDSSVRLWDITAKKLMFRNEQPDYPNFVLQGYPDGQFIKWNGGIVKIGPGAYEKPEYNIKILLLVLR